MVCCVCVCVCARPDWLLQAGTLKVGDVVSAGATHGKVRTLSNAAGSAISSAGPSIAVQLIGLNAVPQAGDEFQVCVCVSVLGWRGRGCSVREHEHVGVA